MITKIYLNYPLCKIPNGGLYRYNGVFYRKVFSKPAFNYCWSESAEGRPRGCASVLDMSVQYYKES